MAGAALQKQAISWRQIGPEEYPLIRPLMRAVLETERFFTLPATGTDEKAIEYWFKGKDAETWIAEENGKVLGSFYLSRNHYELGGHIGNGGYLVAPDVRGRGIGRMLGEKSIERARERGLRGIQFNFVVSTNEPAVHLWQELGFRIIGTIPGGYFEEHKRYVDAYIMFKDLVSQ